MEHQPGLCQLPILELLLLRQLLHTRQVTHTQPAIRCLHLLLYRSRLLQITRLPLLPQESAIRYRLLLFHNPRAPTIRLPRRQRLVNRFLLLFHSLLVPIIRLPRHQRPTSQRLHLPREPPIRHRLLLLYHHLLLLLLQSLSALVSYTLRISVNTSKHN